MDPRVEIRAASGDDLDFVLPLTRSIRSRLATWAPVYFNPAEQADDMHAGYLTFILDADDHETMVLTAKGEPVGFFVNVAQPAHMWVDDLCVIDEGLWPAVGQAIARAHDAPWATCVSARDHARTNGLRAHGAVVVSSYWARSTTSAASLAVTAPTVHEPQASGSPRHTFGGQAFRADTPGALVIVSDGGRVIGSPSVTPPLYDPGGPTTVIDHVSGPDRSQLVQQALAAAADRGDAQLVLVCSEHDAELTHIATEAGFERVVNLIGT